MALWRDWYFLWCRHGNELLQLPDYCFCSRATTLSVELALKCDETEVSRSENTLQSIKNYKSLANVKKNISLHKQFLHTFGDSIGGTVTIEQLPIAMSQLVLKSTILYQIYYFLITFGELSSIFSQKLHYSLPNLTFFLHIW